MTLASMAVVLLEQASAQLSPRTYLFAEPRTMATGSSFTSIEGTTEEAHPTSQQVAIQLGHWRQNRTTSYTTIYYPFMSWLPDRALLRHAFDCWLADTRMQQYESDDSRSIESKEYWEDYYAALDVEDYLCSRR